MRLPFAVAVAVALAVVASAGALTAAGAGAERDLVGPGSVTVEVGIDHSRFSTDRLDVRQGTVVRFVVANRDPIIHELIVGDDDVHERHERGTEARHPTVPGEVTVGPNETRETIYRFDEPGTVVFACHLPGHLDYGMQGEIVVHASAGRR